MHLDVWQSSRALAAALTIGVALNGEARAQCTTPLTTGLRSPLGIALSNHNNLLVSETGTTGVLHSGRISIVDTEGIRRTLLDGLPSATNDVNEASGPAGLLMRGRTLYVAIGIGDTIQVVAPGFVTLFRGFPFPPGTSVVEQIDPVTGAHAPVLAGLRTAIDVVLGDEEHPSLFVLEHASGPLLPPFSGPGSLTRRDAAGSSVLANCLGRPTSMVRDERSGAFYITELVNGRVVMVP